jgi:uncharacterized protein YqgC (DUF456 family)
MIYYHVVLYVILLVVSLAGVGIVVVNLPGLWLIVASLGVYELLTDHEYASWRTLLAMLIAAAIAEYLEFTSSGRSARRAGASRRGIWGGILGSIIGGIALTGLIPIPILGTVVGLLVGAFAGALIGEFAGGTQIGKSLEIGASAAKGRAIGLGIKFVFGLGMFLTVAIAAFPHHREVSSPMPMQVIPAKNRSATVAS